MAVALEPPPPPPALLLPLPPPPAPQLLLPLLLPAISLPAICCTFTALNRSSTCPYTVRTQSVHHDMVSIAIHVIHTQVDIRREVPNQNAP